MFLASFALMWLIPMGFSEILDQFDSKKNGDKDALDGYYDLCFRVQSGSRKKTETKSFADNTRTIDKIYFWLIIFICCSKLNWMHRIRLPHVGQAQVASDYSLSKSTRSFSMFGLSLHR